MGVSAEVLRCGERETRQQRRLEGNGLSAWLNVREVRVPHCLLTGYPLLWVVAQELTEEVCPSFGDEPELVA
jgi:hypothetical protein